MSWVPELSQAPESSKIEGAQLSQMLRFCRFSGSKNGHGADWFLACLIDPRLINEAPLSRRVSRVFLRLFVGGRWRVMCSPS